MAEFEQRKEGGHVISKAVIYMLILQNTYT